MAAGDGGSNTEVGLRPSIDHSVADPVKAVTEVKYQEISLPLAYTHTHTRPLNTPADFPLVADEVS